MKVANLQSNERARELFANQGAKPASGRSTAHPVVFTPPPGAASTPDVVMTGELKLRSMNKTEALYAEQLERRRLQGELVWWEYEIINIRLADKTWYLVDFCVMTSTGALECHEVKASKKDGSLLATDDAIAKLKIAASKFPAPFYLAVKVKQRFEIRRI